MKILAPLFLSAMLNPAIARAADDVHVKTVQEATDLANGGSSEAVHDLCYRYIYGKNADQNFQKALQWCSYGAALGIDSSQVLLAELYYEGNGAKESPETALYWYSQAAEQGHEHALLMLYYMYRDGIGVGKDSAVAQRFLQQAVDAGYEPAIKVIGPRPPVKR